ncbi:hypothetical protein Btru_067292 [Bulinus truncatus]|nr:hypothetical protein Btru_067292 [Bulinus truncatus]
MYFEHGDKMAANRDESLDVVLVFGQKKIPIHLNLPAEDASEHITVGHLSEKIQKETNIEPSCQKLIYKGKSLFKTDGIACFSEKLSSFGIRNGDRIMLLARKNLEKKSHDEYKKKLDNSADGHIRPVQNAELFQRLRDVQTEVDKIGLQCDELVRESRTISEPVALKSCKRSFILLHEKSMKLLENVDAIHSNSNEDVRKLKKSIVGSLQVQLDNCEKEISSISDKLLTE